MQFNTFTFVVEIVNFVVLAWVLSRTLALAIRLFGNMMSLELAALLVLMVAGLLVPVPLLLLHALEAVIQAYIFGMLALVYIAGGIQTQELRRRGEPTTQGAAS